MTGEHFVQSMEARLEGVPGRVNAEVYKLGGSQRILTRRCRRGRRMVVERRGGGGWPRLRAAEELPWEEGQEPEDQVGQRTLEVTVDA